MRKEQPFIPGFESEEQAREAGRKFYEKMNGNLGVEGVDFHLSLNEHQRWHFEEGPCPELAAQAGGPRPT